MKKTKVSARYFNFLVCIDKKKNTVIEKRTGKGIWQNLYQFPLIESNRSLKAEEFNLLKLQVLSFKKTYFNNLFVEVEHISNI